MRPSDTERRADGLHRPAHARSDFVDEVLRHVRARGFPGAPLPLGTDERGHRVFEWIDGEVPEQPPFRLDDAQLEAGARLIRGFHDAAASLPGLRGHETVEHGDLGPHNTVFRDGMPVALIDWDDGARPGSRAVDLAQAVWGFADLLEPLVPIARQRDGLHVMCATYGGIGPDEVLAELAARFERARVDHAAGGRAGAVVVFEGLLADLRAGRDELLGRG